MFRVKEAQESETTTARLRRLEYHVWVERNPVVSSKLDVVGADDSLLSASAHMLAMRWAEAPTYPGEHSDMGVNRLKDIILDDGFTLESDTGSGVTRRVVLIKWVADE